MENLVTIGEFAEAARVVAEGASPVTPPTAC